MYLAVRLTAGLTRARFAGVAVQAAVRHLLHHPAWAHPVLIQLVCLR